MTLQVGWRQWPKIAWRDANAKMIASVVLSAVSAFLVFTAGVLLARWLKPAGYGSYALVLSIASIASIPISAGLPTLMMREVARAKAENEWASIKGLINFGFRLVITLSVVALIVLAVFGTISSSHGYDPRILFFVAILLPITGLQLIRQATMQGLGSSLFAQIPGALVRPLILLIIIALGIRQHIGHVIYYALTAYAASLLLSYILAHALLSHQLGGRTKGIRQELSSRAWIRSLVPLGALAATQTWVGNADLLLLAGLGSPTDAGFYKVAMQGVAVMTLVPNAVGMVASTQLSRSYAKNDMAETIRVTDREVRFSMLGSLAAFGAFAIFGESAIALFFGPTYVPAFQVLLVLASGQLLNAATGPCVTILILSRHERWAIVSALIGILSTIVLALILAPSHGVNGMAIASVLGLTASQLSMAVGVRRKTNFDPTLVGCIRRMSHCGE